VFDAPGHADLRCRTFTPSAGTLRTLRIGGRPLFAPLLDRGWTANSDFHPILDLGAERSRFLGRRAAGLEAITIDWRGLAGALEGIDPLPPDTILIPPYVAVAGITGRTGATAFARIGLPDTDDWALQPEETIVRDQWKTWSFRLSGPAPAPWVNFLHAFDDISALAHRGTAGYANPELFRSADAFLLRHRAPSEVRWALEFRRALLAWDMRGVAVAGTALLPSMKRGEGLVGRELYVDGMLVAAVRLRQKTLADAAITHIGQGRPAGAGDLRDALLLAHLQRAFPAPTD
jgi:hypothetical protein